MSSVFQGFLKGRQARLSEENQKTQGMLQTAQLEAAQRKVHTDEARERKAETLFAQQQTQFEQQQTAQAKQVAEGEATEAIKWMMPLTNEEDFEPNRVEFMKDLGAAFGEGNIAPYKDLPLPALQAKLRSMATGKTEGTYSQFERGGKTYLLNNKTAEVREATGVALEEGAKPLIVDLMKERDAAEAAGNTEDAAAIQNQIDKMGAVEQGATAGISGDFIGTKKEGEQLRASEAGIKDALDAFSKVVSTIKETPDAGMTGGKISAKISGLKDEIMSAYSSLGHDTPQEVMNMSSYSDELGVVDEVYRGQVFDAALAYAGAIGLGEGRALTDHDVKRALGRISKNWGTSKKARLAILKDVGGTIANKYKNKYNSLHSTDYAGDIGKGYQALFDGEDKQEFKVGQVVTQDGVSYKYDGTNWVPQ